MDLRSALQLAGATFLIGIIICVIWTYIIALHYGYIHDIFEGRFDRIRQEKAVLKEPLIGILIGITGVLIMGIFISFT